MNQITKITYNPYSDRLEIIHSFKISEHKDWYQVWFAYPPFGNKSFDRVEKARVQTIFNDFGVWNNEVYVSTTAYNKNPDQWIEKVKSFKFNKEK